MPPNLNQSNYERYREHLIDPDTPPAYADPMEEDFNAKEMLESADLDNTEREISAHDFYSGLRSGD
jgi:hypothetical protein